MKREKKGKQKDIKKNKISEQLEKTEKEKKEEKVVAALKEKALTMTTVESCTGGMIAAAITSVAGSSAVFHQGYVTYCDSAKHKMVGVRKKTLRKYTAVSRQTAKEMAFGGARTAKADCCVSVTGYAGPPSGEAGEEVGLVYIGCAFHGKVKVKECHFSGTRNEVREQAKQKALEMLAVRLERQK